MKKVSPRELISSPATQLARKKIDAIFRGIPDSGMVFLTPTKEGGVLPSFPNYSVIPLDIYESLISQRANFWFPSRVNLPVQLVNTFINMCADADEYEKSMDWLNSVATAQKIPVFNHPRQIMNTRRDKISALLQGVPFLSVPNCVRFTPHLPQAFRETFDENNFQYPLLIRPAMSQTGKHLIKIENQDDWDKIYSIPWPGQTMYMTQFVDFKDETGLYTKLRVAIVGDTYSVRHVKFDTSWNVHNTENASQMLEREMAIIDTVESSGSFHQMMAEILQRIHLDFWGLDIGYNSARDELLFFEGNAAMSMLFSQPAGSRPYRTETSPLAQRRAQIAKGLKVKLKSQLEDPKIWVEQPN